MTFVTLALLVGGLVTLVGGAELVVRGSSRLAAAFGMSPLLIGLTLVAFGTSAPEIAVGVNAALAGNGSVALGNVAGSNIFNVLLVLGASAMLAPLVVERQLIRLDVPVLIGVSTLPLILGLDHRLSRGEGGLLLGLGVAYTGILAFLAFRTGAAVAVPGRVDRPGTSGGEPPEPDAGSAKDRVVDVVLLVAGFAALVVGSGWFVRGATEIARSMGISDLVIGLTLVAAATSLPELATSLMAAIRGERDMAVGNAVGSNIFNILIVLGASSVAVPGGLEMPMGALTFDFPIVFLVAAVCLPVFFTGRRISRGEGVVFVAYYVVYVTYILLDAATHDAQDEFVTVLLLFVVPLTLILVAGGWWWGRAGSDEEA